MKISLLILILIAFVILGFRSYKLTANNNNLKNREKTLLISGKEFANKLEVLGYFKYTDSQNIKHLKLAIEENFGPNSGVSTIYDEETNLPLDYRHFLCDGESVSQTGGVLKLLSELSEAFKKIGFDCKIGESFEKWNQTEKLMNQWIEINGSKYFIYKDYEPDFSIETVYRIAKILNIELEKQQIKERVFLSDAGNSGILHILTFEIQEYICTIFNHPLVQPQTPDKWIKENQLNTSEIEWEHTIK